LLNVRHAPDTRPSGAKTGRAANVENTDEGAVNPLPVNLGRDFTPARNGLASAQVCPVVPPKFGFDLFLIRQVRTSAEVSHIALNCVAHAISEMNHGRLGAPPIFVAGMTIRMILRAAIALAAVAIVVFIGAIMRLTAMHVIASAHVALHEMREVIAFEVEAAPHMLQCRIHPQC
jgi:hypothetical protein